VVTSAAALATELAKVPGVRDVRVVAPLAGEHRLEVHADDDVRAALFAWAVAQGHVLVELSAVTRPLEEVFRRLTEAVA
jgi:hypothetical protein